jgi:hypothetical protein
MVLCMFNSSAFCAIVCRTYVERHQNAASLKDVQKVVAFPAATVGRAQVGGSHRNCAGHKLGLIAPACRIGDHGGGLLTHHASGGQDPSCAGCIGGVPAPSCTGHRPGFLSIRPDRPTMPQDASGAKSAIQTLGIGSGRALPGRAFEHRANPQGMAWLRQVRPVDLAASRCPPRALSPPTGLLRCQEGQPVSTNRPQRRSRGPRGRDLPT